MSSSSSLVSEDNFYDHLTLGIAKTLERTPGVQTIHTDRREPCEKSMINSWEQRHSCILPCDMKNFYLSTDGFFMSWTYGHGSEEAPIGNFHINPLSKLRRIAGHNYSSNEGEGLPCLADLDLLVPKSLKENPLFNATCKIFELDPCRSIATVCLVYVEHKINPSLWFLDRSLEWHFLAPTFTDYFRMMLVYQGLPEWQFNLTSIGLPPWAEQLMYTITPHLHSPPPTKRNVPVSEIQLDPSIFKSRSRPSRKQRPTINQESVDKKDDNKPKNDITAKNKPKK